ncbi:MAG: DUF2953 domain-containing protein [Lachnospiraceae bacterium]|nr:DUF2953 domain-containing protein [Lachnospiraceae bacterium]
MIWDVAGIVVLTLLRILGIVLLILLVLLLLVLFVPIRYRVSAAFYEEYEVRGSISWLCFLVRFPFWWKDGQFRWKLQILGIPFRKSAMGMTLSKGTGSGRHTRRHSSGRKSPKQKKAETQSVLSEKKSEESRQPDTNTALLEENALDRYNQSEDAQNKKKHKSCSPFKRLWKKICERYQAVCDMIRNIRRKVHSVQDLIRLLQKDSSRRFICIAKENMLQLWKHLKPQKIQGEIRFGTGDPCSTGQILGGIAVFYSWLGTGVHITPDFEEACFEGRIKGKGRIRVITMIIILIRLIRNKDFRKLQREWRQWKEDF